MKGSFNHLPILPLHLKHKQNKSKIVKKQVATPTPQAEQRNYVLDR